MARNLYYDQNYVSKDERLTGLTTMTGGSTLQSLLLSYDVTDQITGITNYTNTGLTQAYGYDARGRLTSDAARAKKIFSTANLLPLLCVS